MVYEKLIPTLKEENMFIIALRTALKIFIICVLEYHALLQD